MTTVVLFLQCSGLLEERIFQFVFILSQRKVSRLLRLLDRPLTLREQITNSLIGNLLMIKSSELECRNTVQIMIVTTS